MERRHLNSVLILITLSWLISSCGSNEEKIKKPTLADIDVTDEASLQADVFVKPKSDEEIKEAYYNYIKSAGKDDSSRQTAINRLAELELELSNKLLKDSKGEENEDIDDALYLETLKKTANLLETSLRDYPKAKGNDISLYQLARTYDQLGNYQGSIESLQKLIEQYPKSKHYSEAQFRIAETAFVQGDYITAEDAYTEVIMSPDGDRFYEKSLFKRGWTRYKQQLYFEAIDDYLEALTQHDFGNYDDLNQSDKDQFDEFFRAIGLTFSHLRGAETLQSYFADREDFKYLYHTYTVISDIYLKQERFSDAAKTMEQFVAQYPQSPNVPLAKLKAIDSWKQGNFANQLYASIDAFYLSYHPNHPYWQSNGNEDALKKVNAVLREEINLITAYFHKRYQNRGKQDDYQKAILWYERYLAHYQAYAQKDDIYKLFAELLHSQKEYQRSLKYFELAAYDGELILDKKAAYSTIAISDQILRMKESQNKALWLEKHLKYAKSYAQLYPEDKQTEEIALHAAELAFTDKQYEKAIELGDLLPKESSKTSTQAVNVIKALSYFENKEYDNSETILIGLVEGGSLTRKRRKELLDSLALSIYRQAEIAKNEGDIAQANHHFLRISKRVPNSEIASTGMYDAIALSMANEMWTEAIHYIKEFQRMYPDHSRQKDVTRKLSVAYLKSDQGTEAAKQFEQISSFEEDREVKMAALWQAAQLYESKNKAQEAIRSYRTYAHTYKTPYPQYMEAMHKLTELYKKQNDIQKRYFWQRKIVSANKNASDKNKNDRTLYIASTTALDLAKQKHQEYKKRRLVEPLAKNLRIKKKAMQDSITLFGRASAFGVAEITTESTYMIAEIYRDFSTALLESERPNNLSPEELDQYNILLEDQAFPFEEKAIEFYETNLARTQDGTYNEWIKNSQSQLVTLFPVRYQREGKVEVYSNE